MHESELQSEREHLRVLLELTIAVTTRDVASLAAAIAPNLQRVVAHDDVSVFLLHPASEQMGHYALTALDVGWTDELTAELRPDTEPLATWLEERRTVNIPLEQFDWTGREEIHRNVTAAGLKYACFVPLVTPRGTLGFLLLNRRASAPFTPEEMNWSSQAAAQIAMALENALAFREIGALKDRLARENVQLEEEIRERRGAEEARRCAEAELQQIRSVLAHRQRVSLLGEVAASLAHEIKQPIAAATLDAHVCLQALGEARLNLQSAREAASRMLKDATWPDEIISRTSALYRKDTLQRERVDVNAVIRHISLLLQQEADGAAVSIRTVLADHLPEVMADRVQLQQVCMNLMLNAIEAMKGTGGDLTITSVMRDARELLVSVSDQGVGLPDNPDTIFEAFVTTKPHGTGMGLAITRSIVEAHGGRVWATANTGPGATFFVILPADTTEPPPSRSL